jgi:hypothetical protein
VAAIDKIGSFGKLDKLRCGVKRKGPGDDFSPPGTWSLLLVKTNYWNDQGD